MFYKSIYWVQGCGNSVCHLLFMHCPPAWLYPAPTCTPSPFACTWEHTRPLCLIFTPAPLAHSTLCLGCTLPCLHTLCTSTVCFLGCTAHHSVPPPLMCMVPLCVVLH